MIKLRLLLALFLCVTSYSAPAREPAVPKMVSGGSAIGIDVSLRPPIGFPALQPDIVFFVKTEPGGELTKFQVLPSDYVEDGRAYLLNVLPGEYVAVGAARSNRQSGTFTTCFSAELAESTRVSVGMGEVAFMGRFRVRASVSMRAADPVQKFYARLFDVMLADMPAMKLVYAGRAEQSLRDGDARREFLLKAKDDLAGGGWTELVLAALDPSVRSAQAANPPIGAKESPVALAHMLADRIEGLTQGVPADEKLFETTAKALRDHVAASPDDVDALIALARLSLLEGIATPYVQTPENERPPGPAAQYEVAHEHLDRAITLQPQNADAYYWKARLFGVLAPDLDGDVIDYRSIDAEQAIVFARKAVALAPADARYKDTLAQYLAGQYEYDEAMKVLESLPDGRQHLLFALLHDFATFPVPENAVFDRIASRSFAEMLAGRGRFTGYPYERVREYVVPGPARDVETFLRQRWPQFKLPKAESVSDEGGALSLRLVAFRLIDGAQLKSPPDEPKDVMMLALLEDHNPAPEIRKRLPVAVGDVYCRMILTDYRSVAPRK